MDQTERAVSTGDPFDNIREMLLQHLAQRRDEQSMREIGTRRRRGRSASHAADDYADGMRGALEDAIAEIMDASGFEGTFLAGRRLKGKLRQAQGSIEFAERAVADRSLGLVDYDAAQEIPGHLEGLLGGMERQLGRRDGLAYVCSLLQSVFTL